MTTSIESPFHQGEQFVQTQQGVRDRMEQFGQRVIRDHLPEQHREFYQQLPFVFLGHWDTQGWPWASIIVNRPGFMQSPDPKTLLINAMPIKGDPLAAAMANNTRFGLLGIELTTRRRNRLSAHISAVNEHGFELTVDQTFGNCPQYIQLREFVDQADDSKATDKQGSAPAQLSTLNEQAQQLIANSDTFFVASYIDSGSGQASEGADVSHRGGKPGFIRIDDHKTLTIPDYLGNNHFNTLGNFVENPKAGLLFIDFERGAILTLTGTVEIVWQSDELSHFAGAQRLWRFHLDHGYWLENAIAGHWQLTEYSRNTLLTGTWQEAAAQEKAELQRSQWLSYTVEKVVDECQDVKSFYLQPTVFARHDFQAGQFLTIKADIAGVQHIRTYTVSSGPADPGFRISVKRQALPDSPDSSANGSLEQSFSNYLHDHVNAGSELICKAPCGSFTFNAAEARPAVMLAAGIGITPLLSMARYGVTEGYRTRKRRAMTFIAAVHDHQQRPFVDELKTLVELSNDSLRVFWCLSQVDSGLKPGVDFQHSGRIDKALLQAVLPLDDYDYYLCGPQSFMQSMYDLLRSLGVSDQRIEAEAFGPAALTRQYDRPSSHRGQGTVSRTSNNVMAAAAVVSFDHSQVEQAWQSADGNLLDFAEAHGLTPEYGCRSGQCGACKVPLLAGQVTYISQPSIDIADNEVLLCCAAPAQQADETVVRIKLGL